MMHASQDQRMNPMGDEFGLSRKRLDVMETLSFAAVNTMDPSVNCKLFVVSNRLVMSSFLIAGAGNVSGLLYPLLALCVLC